MNTVCGDDKIGNYRIKNGKLERNINKEKGFNYMFTGIYIITKKVFKNIKDEKFSSVELFDIAAQKSRLGFIVNKSTFYHIGTPRALKKAKENLKINQ